MATRPQHGFLSALASLDLEERILNGGTLIAMLGIFLPWLSGQWLGGDTATYSGFGFFTTFIGFAAFCLHAFVLTMTLLPLAGGPQLLGKKYREGARMLASLQATVLLLAALSVLMKITLEFSNMEVRFGVYVALFGSLASSLYAFIRYHEYKKSLLIEHFGHPEDTPAVPEASLFEPAVMPPPPPPPPALEPEEHPLALQHDHR